MSIDKFGKFHHNSHVEKLHNQSIFTITGEIYKHFTFIHTKPPGVLKINIQKPSDAILKKNSVRIDINEPTRVETNDVFEVSFPNNTDEKECFIELDYSSNFVRHINTIKKNIESLHTFKFKLPPVIINEYQCVPETIQIYLNGKKYTNIIGTVLRTGDQISFSNLDNTYFSTYFSITPI